MWCVCMCVCVCNVCVACVYVSMFARGQARTQQHPSSNSSEKVHIRLSTFTLFFKVRFCYIYVINSFECWETVDICSILET